MRKAAVCTVFVSFLSIAGAATASAKDFSEAEVSEAARAHVAMQSKNGVFTLRDPARDRTLALVFDDVKLVRGIEGLGWFPSLLFHDQNEPGKVYGIDFWLKPAGDELEFLAARVHKEPQQEDGAWVSLTRAPLVWWWLPTLERASSIGKLRRWHLMAAVHEHVIRQSVDGLYRPEGVDGVAGAALELVDIIETVQRSPDDGRYLVCADFRKPGAGDLVTLGFWLEKPGGAVSAFAMGSRRPGDDGGGAPQAAQVCKLEGKPLESVK